MPGRFDTVTNLSTNQRAAIDAVRSDYAALESAMAHVPEGRHKSLALTALEESCMWAVKAISHAPNAGA